MLINGIYPLNFEGFSEEETQSWQKNPSDHIPIKPTAI